MGRRAQLPELDELNQSPWLIAVEIGSQQGEAFDSIHYNVRCKDELTGTTHLLQLRRRL